MAFKQRFLHYYFLNELTHSAVLLWLFTSAPLARWLPAASRVLPAWLVALACYGGFYLANFLALFLVLLVRTARRAAGHRHTAYAAPRHALPAWRSLSCTARDGVALTVHVSDGGGGASAAAAAAATGSSSPGPRTRRQRQQQQQPQTAAAASVIERRPRRVMLLAAPLGQCGPAIYNLIL